ncbi:MAG TPA: hypothetical protein VHX38_39425 [Pseudonocardiaceae bacterium]|jgi:hypothetical protein|nr:hypothetical protein [Pseudonocardiaceae bacterium]
MSVGGALPAQAAHQAGVVIVPVHRLEDGAVFAVEFRPGSTVVSRVEGELIVMEVSYPRQVTVTIVWPVDTALSMLESLRRPEGAISITEPKRSRRPRWP